MLTLFLSFGAKLDARTRSGMNAMHLAAKSDQILVLSWLRNKAYDAQILDNELNSPLHYAAIHCCEFASAVLLSWKVDVNLLNIKKESPLFLAVQSGSHRIIRSLLLRGADVKCKDIEGKTPLDIALEKGSQDIVALIKPPGILSKCGIKPPQRPIRFKKMLMTIYMLLLATGIFSLTYLLEIDDLYYDVLAGLELIFFVFACCKDPGYIQKNHEHMLFELTKSVECYQICPECVIRRPPRSRHCQCCNKCVEKFDHHCPWINNCIGGRNLGLFYCFLIVTLTFICYSGYLSVIYIKDHVQEQSFFTDFKFFVALVWVIIPLSFFVPLFLLVSVQTRNFLSNTTTNERYSRRVEANKVERTDSDEQVDRSSWVRNIWYMCSNTQIQEYKNRSSALAQTEGVTRYSSILKDYELSQRFLTDNSN